jgi:hypothetical protein
MVSIDPNLPQAAVDSDLIIQFKTTIIRALRGTIQDPQYPDRKLGSLQVSMEYPMELASYPHLWVEFSFTKFQAAGIGHFLVNEEGNMSGEWYFEGASRMTLMSMTSFERDAYSSQLLNMFAFSNFHPAAQKFDEILHDSTINMSVDRDQFIPGGQTTNVGSPWDPEALVYQDVYSIRVVGQVQSTFSQTTSNVAGVELVADGWVGQDPSVLDPDLHVDL